MYAYNTTTLMWGRPAPATVESPGPQVQPPQCSLAPWLHAEDGYVVSNITDGTNTRCYSVIAPASAKTPMPVLFWFHGSGGSAKGCGLETDDQRVDHSLALEAVKNGFALVCGEATQYEITPGGAGGGQWDIPEIMTDATGTPCDSSDSVDVNYMTAVLDSLGQAGTFDMKHLYTSGCSMGSAFSSYSSTCMRGLGHSIPAFATHSTGLKIKGDGNTMPATTFDPGYTWGECPTCQYFPFVPTKQPDLKACIFDDYSDPTPMDPFFYRTSLQLVKNYTAFGNKVDHSYAQGGHCGIKSYMDIATCLDDGTGNLLKNGANASVPARYRSLVELP